MTNDIPTLSPDQSVGEWVTADYRLATIFEQHGIDFCCGGNRPVRVACAEQGITPERILQEAAHVTETPGTAERYDQWALDFLADYIVNQFHLYTRDMLPRLTDYLAAVAEAHGDTHPETRTIAALWPRVRGELAMHMQKEEMLLFPYIRHLVRSETEGTAPVAPPFGSVQTLIDDMEAEHEDTGDALAEIARLSDNYTPPADACPTYQLLYRELQAFEAATKKHIHLENNILFPKAITLEGHLVSARG